MATSAKTTSKIGSEALKEKTGKTWAEWFSLLDKAGAKERTHQEIVALLKEHGVGQWWGQMVTVGFEQERGLRVPHQKSSGFEISVSKTVNIALGMAFLLFEDSKMRKRWMKDPAFEVRKATANKSLRITWPDETSVVVDFYPKGSNKTQIVVQHQKIPSARAAEKQKGYWAEQLNQLKATMEE
jgi:hypothetical protein